jgi:hypothetical protein
MFIPDLAPGCQGALFEKTAREASGPPQKLFIKGESWRAKICYLSNPDKEVRCQTRIHPNLSWQ